MWRRICALLLAIALLALDTTPAFACSCVGFRTARAHISSTDLIFIGTAQRSDVTSQRDMTTTFLVSEVLKGESSRTVHHGRPEVCCMCGVGFDLGERVMVFAELYDGRYRTSACSSPRFTEALYRAALLPMPRQPR